MHTPLLTRVTTIAALFVPVMACGQAPAAQRPPQAQAGGMTFDQYETRRLGRMMAMDTDGDGRISRAEFIAGSAAKKGEPAGRFARLDANGDGYLDRGEIDAMLKRHFDRIDADHDGTATAAERAAAHEGRARPDDNG